jgi:hypothetical protein
MMFLRYAMACWAAWRMLRSNSPSIAYVAWAHRGVPCLALFVARDMEAWRVTQLALDAHPSTAYAKRAAQESTPEAK